MSKRTILILSKATVSIGLIAFILARTDLGEMGTLIQRIDVSFFAGGFACLIAGLFLRAYKWQLLLQAQDVRFSYRSCVTVNCISLFMNNFFLGTLGGDAYRVYRARGYSENTGSATSSVIMERLTGFFAALLVVLTTGVFLVFESQNLVSVRALILLSLIGAGVGIALALVLLVFSRTSGLLTRLPLARKFTQDLSKSTWRYNKHRGAVFAGLFLSLVFYALQGLSVYLFVRAVDATVPVLPLLYIVPLVGILVVVPISINGIGVKEGIYVFYLMQLGLANPTAVVIALSSRFVNVVISLFGGVLFLARSWSRKAPAPVTDTLREAEKIPLSSNP